MRNSFIMRLASATFEPLDKVTGSNIIPDSERFTVRTSLACSSILMFLCKTAIPPSRAIAIAISDSETVSIAAETMGVFKEMFLENLEVISTSRGNTSE